METFAQRNGKVIIGGLMVAILALALIGLQQRFDEGDNERAIALLMSKTPGSAWSVVEELNVRAGKQAPQCQPRIVSSFAGTLDVHCLAGSATYRFGVDLVRKTVNPLDPPTRELIATVSARNGGVVDGGSSPLPPPAVTP